MRVIRNHLLTIFVFSMLNVNGQIIEAEEAVLSFEDFTTVDVAMNLSDNEIPFWSTSSSDKLIELWVDGTADVSASDGKYFVELNATELSSLYFDIKTTGYDTLNLSFDHRARLSGGFDEIEIQSGAIGQIIKAYGSFKSDNQKWTTNTIEIPIEEGHDLTRIIFEGISTVSNDPTVGNFIDNVRFNLIKTKVKPEEVTIKLYPNPFVDYIVFNAENSESNFEISIYDMLGELKKQQQVKSKSNINLEELKAGLFLVKILDTKTEKIIQTKVIKH